MKSIPGALGLVSAALLWAGCTTVDVQETGDPSIQTQLHEAVAILTMSDSSLEGEAVGCIGAAIRGANPQVQIITPEEFRQSIFFYRITEEEKIPDYLASLAQHPTVRERMVSRRIRYLIAVSGSTKELRKRSAGALGGGLGGGLLLFWKSSDQKTYLSASVLDLEQDLAPQKVEASASGRPWVFFALPLPLILGAPASTETEACNSIGDAVVKLLSGENLTDIKKQNDKYRPVSVSTLEP